MLSKFYRSVTFPRQITREVSFTDHYVTTVNFNISFSLDKFNFIFRFYLSKGKNEEALDLLKTVAKTNGNTVPEDCKLHEDIDVSISFLKILKNFRLIR